MKKLGYFKSSLLVSAVALSVLSSSANAVSEEAVRAYWKQTCGAYHILTQETQEHLMRFDEAQWQQFIATASALITEDMSESDHTSVIKALANVSPDKLFHESFLPIASALIAENMDGSDRAYVIDALANVSPDKLFHESFLPTASALITKNMSVHDRVYVILALGKVIPEKWPTFVTTAKSLITTDMDGENRANVIEALGKVIPEKTARVYSQIQRLMRETHGKIQLRRSDAASQLIRQLRNCDTDERAQAFTNDLIQRVRATQGNIEDDAFLTHLNTAWDRVRGASQNELQELARQRQSTHKKEVHASVAESVKRLDVKYKDQLLEGDIFELIHAVLMSVFLENMESLLKNAVVAAKALVDPLAIEDLLKISPHVRAGEGNADTALNVAARRLWTGNSEDARKAIQDVVRLHSQKEDFREASKLLETLKRNLDFKDGISQVGYGPLLRLIYAAITDESWGDAQDIPGRWRSLMTRMSRAQNEYRPGDEACLAGLFNALLEPLSGVHPDVLIIPSFRLMMEEISLEPSEKEYKRRVDLALSYLGSKAREDQDYMKVIADVTLARMERQSEEEDPETKLLEGLRTSLDLLKERPDAEFEAEVQKLVGALPQTLQDQPLLWKSVVAQARKARAEEREVPTQPRGLGAHPSREREA